MNREGQDTVKHFHHDCSGMAHASYKVKVALRHTFIILPQVVTDIAVSTDVRPVLRPGEQDKGV